MRYLKFTIPAQIVIGAACILAAKANLDGRLAFIWVGIVATAMAGAFFVSAAVMIRGEK